MKTVYFISDNHFGDGVNEKQKIEKLTSFFEYLRGARPSRQSALFIVGDLFDFYFEHKHVIPKKHLYIISKLRELRESGVEIHYFAGNHDFWIGSSFKEMGIKIYKEPAILEIQGKKIFISHGDEFTNSWFFRFILRNRVFIFLFYLIHPDMAYKIGVFVSRLSRKSVGKNIMIWKTLRKVTREKFKKGFDIVIFGHIHSPKYIKENGKVFILLGDWETHFSYGKLEDGKIILDYWEK